MFIIKRNCGALFMNYEWPTYSRFLLEDLRVFLRTLTWILKNRVLAGALLAAAEFFLKVSRAIKMARKIRPLLLIASLLITIPYGQKNQTRSRCLAPIILEQTTESLWAVHVLSRTGSRAGDEPG